MTKADQVRDYVLQTYILPARKRSPAPVAVTVVAGDVARALKMSNRMPLVCGALGTEKFQKENRIHLVKRTGPGQGPTATFVFAV